MHAANDLEAEAIGFSDYLNSLQREITRELEAWFRPLSARISVGRVVEASCYSLLLPSKRLRPIFCLETARAFGAKDEEAMPAAMALEMVHSYSLIHDDLPAMDDDDLRRGQPTNHKKYGEATAILAGDGLLTSAFEVLSKKGDVAPLTRIRWIQELAEASGMAGMVLGQDIDIQAFETIKTLEDLEDMHRKKTGSLLSAAVVMGAIAAGADLSTVEKLRSYAFDMGLAFQIRDDVLDVEGGNEIGKPPRSDERKQKPTYVSFLGIEKAKEEAQRWYDRALKSLSQINFTEEHRLEELTRFVVKRDK